MDIEWLQNFCGTLPAVTEDIKWGNDLCFCIGDKMFCVAGLNETLKVSFKVSEDEFEELCSRKGVIPAPYMARHKWILAESTSFKKKEWEHYIHQSYEMVREKLPAKIKKGLPVQVIPRQSDK